MVLYEPSQLDLYCLHRDLPWLLGVGVVGCGVVYLTLLGSPTDIGLQIGKACYPYRR